VFDAKALLDDVRSMVAEQREREIDAQTAQ